MLGTTSCPTKSVVFQGNSIYFQYHRPGTIDLPVPSLTHLKDLLPEKAVKMKISVMRRSWSTGTLGPALFMLDPHTGIWPLCGLVSSVARGCGLACKNLPELHLLRFPSFPRKCISCTTCFTSCFRRNVMIDDHMKLIWLQGLLILAKLFTWLRASAKKNQTLPLSQNQSCVVHRIHYLHYQEPHMFSMSFFFFQRDSPTLLPRVCSWNPGLK